MIKELRLRVSPQEAGTTKILRRKIAEELTIKESAINSWRVVKKSVDARKKRVMVNLALLVATGEDKEVTPQLTPKIYRKIDENAIPVVIVGAGPAGLFAALKAIELGLKPIVIERGRNVDDRRRDIANISRKKIINPKSNYCFGEGGAGAFSDGKLFTRSKKRGNVDEILQILCQHGASSDILVDSHPHIGSDKLPLIIASIRETILTNGGEVFFDTQMESIIVEDNTVKGIVTTAGQKIYGAVVLAIGHSARDTIRSLHSQGVEMQAKGFAMGVRLEHPQHLIDRLQYHSKEGRGDYLPAAEYSFVTQADGRGVYSFCMCPGGVIVPAASAGEESVVNGMSASTRAGKWANSGMVVEIRPDDFPEYASYGELSLLKLQEDVEKKFFKASDNTIVAPAQRMTDFVNGVASTTIMPTSYAPGIYAANMHELLPSFVAERLKKGFIDFDKKCIGFLSPEAQLIGLESRTSSPVRIPRDNTKLTHLRLKNFYPAGEGAGYAGGIVSAAIDGSRCVEAYFKSLQEKEN